ncbi:MAG: hypothetical protein OXE78_11820, partial [Gammaproteobacteria bacterium]|nr:hypothetical protein [Gammaproteobacteria bacterium]
AVEGRVCNLLQRMVAAEIVQHKLIKASTNIGHCHGLLRSYHLIDTDNQIGMNLWMLSSNPHHSDSQMSVIIM